MIWFVPMGIYSSPTREHYAVCCYLIPTDTGSHIVAESDQFFDKFISQTASSTSALFLFLFLKYNG